MQRRGLARAERSYVRAPSYAVVAAEAVYALLDPAGGSLDRTRTRSAGVALLPSESTERDRHRDGKRAFVPVLIDQPQRKLGQDGNAY